MAGGGAGQAVMHSGTYLEGKALRFPIFMITLLFFLWGFSYGLLDVLNSHFQTVLHITKLESTGLQIAYFGGGYFLYSPIAGEVMRRYGYKKTIIMGLTLYSLGAIMFWPTAHYTTYDNRRAAFGGFVACTFVIACGLATLEVSANSYATIIGDPRTASRRLQFTQAWNGVASFIGPLIASHAFFNGENANNLTNVQFVYLSVAIMGLMVNIGYILWKMPEISEETLQAIREAEALAQGDAPDKPLWKEFNCVYAFVAQFAYVGAQVTVASFFINYANENGGLAKSRASFLLSMSLLLFTLARFIGVGLLTIFAPNFILTVYSVGTIVLCVLCVVVKGKAAIGCIMSLFFFMSIMYPIIFVMGTANLGKNTRRGAALLVMGVAGGAVFPPIQGAIADSVSTRVSYIAPAAGFVVVLSYAGQHWFRDGMPVLLRKPINPDEEGAVISSSIGELVGQPIGGGAVRRPGSLKEEEIDDTKF